MIDRGGGARKQANGKRLGRNLREIVLPVSSSRHAMDAKTRLPSRQTVPEFGVRYGGRTAASIRVHVRIGR